MSEPVARSNHTAERFDLEHLPWVWLGALFVLFLFTPLGRLWPLAWVIAGTGVLSGNLKARDAIAYALIAILAGTFTVGNWLDLIPSNASTPEAEASEVQFVSLEGVRRIELRSFNGSIKVSNTPGPARLIVHRKGNVSVRSETINEILNVQAKRPFFAWNTAASLELILPAPQPLEPRLSLSLITANGPIEVSAQVERIEASSNGGRILIRDSGAKFTQVNNSNAPIEIANASGTLLASTSNASIQVSDAKEITLRLETSNGAIRLERPQFAANSRSSARGSNAPIDLIAPRAPAGLTLRGETANAKLDVTLPGFEIKLEGQRFEARQNGLGVAELELETANAGINVKP